MLEIDERTRILDVATGTGGMLRELAALDRPPSAVTAIDSSAGMLDRVPPLPDGWRLLRADATALPLADAGFDRAAAYLLHLLDPGTRERVLAELHRVLVPGGLLGVFTVAPAAGLLGRLLRLPLAAVPERVSGVLAGLRPLDPGPELEAAGFRLLRGKRIRRGYPSLCVLAARL